jgi:hypothetical protein
LGVFFVMSDWGQNWDFWLVNWLKFEVLYFLTRQMRWILGKHGALCYNIFDTCDKNLQNLVENLDQIS